MNTEKFTGRATVYEKYRSYYPKFRGVTMRKMLPLHQAILMLDDISIKE